MEYAHLIMTVKDIMQKKVISVTPKTKLIDAAKLIFKQTHNGLPVVDGHNKLVGFITDQDILSQCFPSIKDYMEDIVHEKDFTAMEKKISEIMKMSVEDVMNRNVVSIKSDREVLKAESIMKVKDIARLPVVDEMNHLIGILTKRDIFRALVGKVI